MGAAINGVILYLIGKVAHIDIIEKIGYYLMIFGIVTWGLSMVGFSFSLPFVGCCL